MTKAIKWYIKMVWWQVVLLIIAPPIAVLEGFALKNDWPWWAHVLISMLGGVLAAGKYLAKDENNNGILDFAEKKSTK